jgi:hypothetical protein
MALSRFKWLRELQQPNKASRAITNDPNVPKNHQSIAGMPEEANWIAAEEEEIAQLIAMGTWELVPLPKGRQAIKSTWVYRLKKDADGTITRYKARLCACGYSQRAGVDYKGIYAPVFRMEYSRIFLTIIASRRMKMIQMDVTGAFINGKFEEEIYMKQPEGYEDISRADYVLLLLRFETSAKGVAPNHHSIPYIVGIQTYGC